MREMLVVSFADVAVSVMGSKSSFSTSDGAADDDAMPRSTLKSSVEQVAVRIQKENRDFSSHRRQRFFIVGCSSMCNRRGTIA